jgi:hypothetical protein
MIMLWDSSAAQTQAPEILRFRRLKERGMPSARSRRPQLKLLKFNGYL